ncbi:MAG: hypoxanthine phosphoribosyltransferase [Fimbriimonadales bacterium]
MAGPTLDVLFSETQIQARIDEMAAAIRETYGDEPVIAVGVLKGSAIFLADLVRRLGHNVEMDFVQVSSYGSERSSSGVVQIRKDLDSNIEGRHVLIVEDIIDTGITLAHLRELLSVRKPKSLRFATLLSKPEARQRHIPVEFVGFEIPNEFVVGYGLDFAEKFRNLPYIAILRDQ